MEDENSSVFHVQCASSSDFVVGRQTNFNAPVTIIANGSPLAEGKLENGGVNSGIVLCCQPLAEDTVRAVSAANARVNHPCFIHTGDKPGSSSSHATEELLQNSWSSLLQIARARPWLGVPVFVWIIVGIAVTCSFIGALVQILTDNNYNVISSNLPSDDDCKQFLGNSTHLFLTREAWRGVNATSRIEIRHPVPFVIISHTVSAFCYTLESCSSIVRNTQKDTMSRTPPFADLPFNFLVGGDGNVYEGRGWNYRSPHEGLINNRNIDISFIGDFSVHDTPTLTQIDAVQQLVQHGVKHGHLATDYLLLPHNATSRTLSPGKKIYELISQWPHFSPKLPLEPKKSRGPL